MKNKFSLPGLFLNILAILLFASFTTNAQNWNDLGSPFPSGFHYSLVDNQSNPGVGVDMAVSKNGVVYVLNKMTQQNSYRVYKTPGNGVWSPVGDIIYALPGMSLAVDSAGTPYVAYSVQDLVNFSGSNYWIYGYYINVQKFNGSSWVDVGNKILYDDYTNDWIYKPAISLTFHNNTPFISYADYTAEGKLSVKKLFGTKWVNVGSNGFSSDVIDYCSIKVGNNGLPVVLYHSATSDTGNIEAVRYTGSYWEKIGNAAFAKNKYASNLPSNLNCGNCSENWFNYGTLTSVNAPFKFVLDGNNNPYVILHGQFVNNGNPSSYASRMCWYNGSGWTNNVIPNSNSFSTSTNVSDSSWLHQFDDIVFAGGYPWIVSTFNNAEVYQTRIKKYNSGSWVDMGLMEEYPNENVGYFLGKDKNETVYFSHAPYTVKKYCGAVLSAPASITGSLSVSCSHTPTVYTASTVAGATSYSWVLPSGWAGASTTNSITVTPGSNSGDIKVAANNSCGTGAFKTITVTVIGEAAQPSVINGLSSIACNGTGTYSVSADYSVFTDSYNRGATVQPLSNGGTPTMTYTTTTTSTGSASTTGATSRTNLQSGTDYSLQILSGNSSATPTAQTSGATYVTGALSNYNSLFSSTLNTNAGPVTWNFNMKTNRTTALSGFAASGYASAVVLAGTNSSLHNTGNGYAVIEIKGTTTNTFKLIKYTNGLSGTQTVLAAPASDYLSSNTSWASVKVVYNPANHQWKFYLRNDGTTANSDFSGVSTQAGSTISDSAYTKTACSIFGFFFNHSTSTTPTSNTALFDNFTVTVAPPYTYQWTLPQLWSGSSTGSSINVTAGANPGTISVKAVNGCGESNAQTIAVNTTGTTRFNFWERGLFNSSLSALCPNQPVTLAIDTILGSAPATYHWIVPSGWSGSSDSSKITLANNGTSGSVGIFYTRGCAISDTTYYFAEYEKAVAAPESILGEVLVCPGSTVTYHVNPVAGAGSYLWTLPSGWTGSSTKDSITVTVGTSSGNITVAALNACGISSATTSKSIQVGGTVTASISSNMGSEVCNFQIGDVLFTAQTNLREYNGDMNPTIDTNIVYDWRINNVSINSTYEGLHLPLFFSGLNYNNLSDGDVISCVISSNKSCLTSASAVSNSITMTIHPFMNPILNLNSQTIFDNNTATACLGNATIELLNASSAQSITWYKNGNDTALSLPSNSISPFVPETPGSFHAEVIDQYGCALSSSGYVVVKDTISRVQAALEYGGSSVNNSLFCQGRYANFYAVPYNSGTSPSYQWYKNGEPIPFATDSIYFAAIATDLNNPNPDILNDGDQIYCKMWSTEECVNQQEVNSNIITVHLTANSSSNIDSVVCQHIPFEYFYNGSLYLSTDSAGSYTLAIPNVAGCDSIITFNLTFTATKSTVIDTVSYTQLPYTWHDTTITVDNIYIYDIGAGYDENVQYWPYYYEYHTTNAAGCDSLVRLALYIVPPYRIYENATICSSQLPYSWKGSLVDTSNTQYSTFILENQLSSGYHTIKAINIYKEKSYTAVNGIDSITYLFLNARVYDSTVLNITASGSYNLPWGNTVSSSGSYSYTYSSINGCDSVVKINLTLTAPSFATLTTKVFLEGYHRGGNSMAATLFDLGKSNDATASDSIQINLWSTNNLSNSSPNYSANGILHTNGLVSVDFPSSVIGNSYYVAVKHRNSIETWSPDPISFATSNTSYDFSTGINKAYSDGVNPPMKSLPNGFYAMYSGDVNQDGTVDGSDMNVVDNNASVAAFGYDNSDTNGDGATDGLDMNIIDNNTQLGLFYARPY